ncbi:unnamed protein product [Discula destructiva]
MDPQPQPQSLPQPPVPASPTALGGALRMWRHDRPAESSTHFKKLVVQMLLGQGVKLSDVTNAAFQNLMSTLNEDAVRQLFPDGGWITADWMVGSYYEVRSLLPPEVREKAYRRSREWIEQADREAGFVASGTGSLANLVI